ncbi:hypothetical protein E2C01_073865 [Portunus trituberculatus]|uniref:Uncharacterized protein n=1 Tax=Portunus trituberculatus TaxID=210409 RepID=A0A5B7I6H5_PORTR|nr:hypothetical protein [Portunus trituberculatus]
MKTKKASSFLPPHVPHRSTTASSSFTVVRITLSCAFILPATPPVHHSQLILRCRKNNIVLSFLSAKLTMALKRLVSGENKPTRKNVVPTIKRKKEIIDKYEKNGRITDCTTEYCIAKSTAATILKKTAH